MNSYGIRNQFTIFITSFLNTCHNATPLYQATPNNNIEILKAFNFPLFPNGFKEGYYNFKDNEKYVLQSILGDEMNNLTKLAKLTAAAYCCNMPLKVPTVFYASNVETLNYIYYFLNMLFCNNISIINKNQCLKPDENLEILAPEIFNKNLIFILTLYDEISNFDGLIKLSKGYYLKNNGMVFKNNLPIVILTCNKKVCNTLKTVINANIIEVMDITDFDRTNIANTDFTSIRQALMVCGAKLFSKCLIDIKTTDDNETLVERFFWNFIEENEKFTTEKSELRKTFQEYINLNGATDKFKSIAICDFLAKRGHEVRKKERLHKGANPVAVVKGIRIKYNEYYEHIQQHTLLPHRDIQKFTKMLNILEDSTINYPALGIVRG